MQRLSLWPTHSHYTDPSCVRARPFLICVRSCWTRSPISSSAPATSDARRRLVNGLQRHLLKPSKHITRRLKRHIQSAAHLRREAGGHHRRRGLPQPQAPGTAAAAHQAALGMRSPPQQWTQQGRAAGPSHPTSTCAAAALAAAARGAARCHSWRAAALLLGQHLAADWPLPLPPWCCHQQTKCRRQCAWRCGHPPCCCCWGQQACWLPTGSAALAEIGCGSRPS